MNIAKIDVESSAQQCHLSDQNNNCMITSLPINNEGNLNLIKEELLSNYKSLIQELYEKAYGIHSWALTNQHVASAVQQAFFIKQKDLLYLCGWYSISATEVRKNKIQLIIYTKGTIEIPFREKIIKVPNTDFVEMKCNDGVWCYGNVAIFLDTKNGRIYPKFHAVYNSEDIYNIYILRSVHLNKTYSTYKIFMNGEEIKSIKKALGTVRYWPGILRLSGTYIRQKIYDICNDEEHTIFLYNNDGYLQTSDKWYAPYIVTKTSKNPFFDSQHNYYYFSKSSMQIYDDVLNSIPESAKVFALENLLPYDTSINYCIQVKKNIDQTSLIHQFQRTSYIGPRIMDVLIPAVVEHLETDSSKESLEFERIWPRKTREAIINEIMIYYKIPREMVLQKLIQFYGPIICHFSKDLYLRISTDREAPDYNKRPKNDKINQRWKREALIYNLVLHFLNGYIFC